MVKGARTSRQNQDGAWSLPVSSKRCSMCKFENNFENDITSAINPQQHRLAALRSPIQH
jgi:hypothetical protein